MSTTTVLERFHLILKLESVKLPWLETQTGIDKKRWENVKYDKTEIRGVEMEAIAQVWPEYAYWLITGEELPEVNQISPLTKAATGGSRNKTANRHKN